ncbi:hypothetical protein QA600_21090 [Natronococcus sp. A-GB1]|uniref:hypothetical protein n=1 Tax=Natronococcus sp. A-GB1 TaxID=3037648 RepID=UPI00241C282D|nr:hypothetical protein [Natronococcus sp. A-GB1]MDG5761822.1 hypothetical protein [Natronococcus sp. A-GB1]
MTTDVDDDGASTIPREVSEDLLSTDDLESRLDRAGGVERDRDRVRRIRDRNTALGFALLGVISFVGGLALTSGQQVLFALAGVGGFAAVLTYALAPERVIEARDGRRVYETCATNVSRLAAELGEPADGCYVPTQETDADGVRLFVPAGFDAAETLAEGSDGPGLFLEPTGASFVRELEDGLPNRPEPLAERLTAALVDRFELVGRAEPAVDAEAGRVDVAVADDVFGPVDQFDHPVVSTLAVGLAAGLERPVDVAVSPETDRGQWLVTCRWTGNAAIEDGVE